MLQKNTKLILLVLAACLMTVVLAGCGNAKTSDQGDQANATVAPRTLTKVTVVLDWTPNTNHTGLYVAKAKGYYAKEGLDVNFIQPGKSGAETIVAAGNAQFGVSYQENVTRARIQGVPLISIAAVIQHNTSGFASTTDKNIKSPKDFEGKTYGGWGAPLEKAMIQSLMETEHADVNKVKIVSIGETDFFTAEKRNIDFAWIFYAWTGVEAKLRNLPINMIYVNKYSDKLDYYTPVLVTNAKMIANKPDEVKAFMAATTQGYQFAIDHPDQAAGILIAAVPDLDSELVKASQEWLSPRYQEGAAQWGVQKLSVWQGYASWMSDHKLLTNPFDASKAFTNDFLPTSIKK